LVDAAERTLVANLGAANHYNLTDLNQPNIHLLKQSQIIYVEGYFLAHSAPVTFELANFARTHNKLFVFNLCGEYVCKDDVFVRNVVLLLPYIDYLFGNRSEFTVFLSQAKTLDLKSQLLQNLFDVHGREKSPPAVGFTGKSDCLTTIVTEGKQSVTIHFIEHQSVSSTSVAVQDVPQHQIKDTIAAGDSFIAGFLYTLVHGGSTKQAINNAIWTAQKMIQQSGSSLPLDRPQLPEQLLDQSPLLPDPPSVLGTELPHHLATQSQKEEAQLTDCLPVKKSKVSEVTKCYSSPRIEEEKCTTVSPENSRENLMMHSQNVTSVHSS